LTKEGNGRVEVEALEKRFGRVRAVDGVSLAAESGEFLALLGPSGSGKTTILMCVAGFEQPDAGRIRIGPEDITTTPPQRRNLGMVFQRYTLFPHMSVLENIAFPLKMRGVARAEREDLARRALATVRLDGYGERMPAQLSGGQQQRVALARAIVYRPPVLLMDEPLSALDKALREEMQLEIKHLQQQLGITVVFVTHDQTEALTMADKVAVLDQGKLCQIGSPRALYETPGTPFVARFIGETNFFEGSSLGDAGVGQLVGVEVAGGINVAAIAAVPLKRGTKALVAVRPERLRLGTPDRHGSLPAKVREAIYSGVATTFMLDAAGGEALRLRAPTGAAPVVLTPGMSVQLHWDPADARAFAGEGA
jgi:spermidine/putrescine ABC transporter ATP-binding subunit